MRITSLTRVLLFSAACTTTGKVPTPVEPPKITPPIAFCPAGAAKLAGAQIRFFPGVTEARAGRSPSRSSVTSWPPDIARCTTSTGVTLILITRPVEFAPLALVA